MPTFEEYPNRKRNEDLIAYNPDNKDYTYSADDLISFYDDKNISTLLLINPDNPSGNYILKNDVFKIAKWAEKRKIRLIVDESFVDFVDKEECPTLINEDIINDYPQLIVIKSISKSFGVPGLRLGVMVCNDLDIINYIKKDVSIWNINSFAEFYMQIFEKYKGDYEDGIKKFKEIRKKYIVELSEIKSLRVVPTQANYVLCEILDKYTARELTRILLDEYNIFIKDLSTKKGFKGQFVRLAIKRPEENDKLIKALETILK
ncbi:aminotransferase class I/II-fold pyridoxal phosphate-dependent enzyme [Haloimpatiens sp. FM7315]|uniref:aminotransferase class I/II-fold pyridoxal phosphate-dependent enzyme n=1 Tax=Haloimpatiens sp. FM7315 TaxID=3298609 RepID=UPI003977BB59